MANSENIKCAKLKDELVRRLKAGEFPFSSRFPGISELEAEYGVSYVTAFKSLKLLEAEGFLECRRGVGFFTLYSEHRPMKSKKVNFVLLDECWQNFRADLDAELSRFQAAGWQVEVVPLKIHDVNKASMVFNSPDAYTLFYCLTADWNRFAATFSQICSRVLVIGKLSGSSRITSIVCDEAATVNQIIDYLHRNERTRPGIFCNIEENELEMFRLGYWRMALQRAGLSLEWIQDHIFPLRVERDGDPAQLRQEFFCQMREHLARRGREMDSIVVAYSRASFMEACRVVGLRVPDDLLPVHIASPQWEINTPYYAMLDNNLSAHFETAFNILEHRFATGKKEPGSYYFCSPMGVRKPSCADALDELNSVTSRK